MTTVKKGATDQTFYFKMVDSVAGTPKTGLTITSIDATYVRDRAAAVKNDLTALSAATDAHTDNKGIQVDSTNSPGLYRIDFPDAAFATGVDRVILAVTCAGCDPAMKEIELVDNQASDVVALLPAALVSGRMDSSVGAMAANVMTAAATAADMVAEIQATLATEAYVDGAIAPVLEDTADLLIDVAAVHTSVDDLPTNAELGTALGAATAPLATAASLSVVAGNVTTLLTDVGNVPTNAELAAALATADDATLAAIAALHNLSAAQVNAEVDTAISDAGLATSASLATAKIAIDAILADTGTDGVVLRVADRGGIRRNTALANFEFVMTDAVNHNPMPGLAVTATRSIDGGALAAGTLGPVTGLSNGIYRISFAAADLNGSVITLRAIAVGADDLLLTIVTSP